MEHAHSHREQRDRRRRPADTSPGQDIRKVDAGQASWAEVLRLQHAAGNQAVQRLLVANGGPVAGSPAIQRAPKKKKKPPVTKLVYVAPDGVISSTPAVTDAIGHVSSDGAFVTPGAVPAAQSPLGKMVAADGTATPLVKVEKVDVGAAPAGATAGDPAKGTTPQTVTFTGKQFGVPFSGGLIPTKVIDLGKGGQPVAPKDLPANLQTKLQAGSRIDLDDGNVWVLMSYPTGGAPLDALTWAASRDSRKDYKSREKVISDEAAKLPADLKTEVDKHLKIISLVSLVEGLWGSVSPGTDPMASLGIFQWGMEKKGTGLGSLGAFFKTLKSRATAAEAKPQTARTETEKLYVDAWHQCVAAGLDIDGNQVKLGGKVATGGQVEQKMKDVMSTGALKTYQLVGAMDWLEDVKAKIVRPGLVAVQNGQIGGGYKDVSSGASATFKVGKRSISLTAPADRATVKDVCTTPKTLGVAANLLVNRPAWVELTVWKVLAGADASANADALLAKIVAAQDAAEAQAAAAAAAATPPAPVPAPTAKTKTKKPKGKPKPPPLAAIDAANAADKTSYEALRRLVWPKATAMSETALMAAFNAQALGLYKVEDDKAKKRGQKRKITYAVRAKRLAMTDLPEW